MDVRLRLHQHSQRHLHTPTSLRCMTQLHIPSRLHSGGLQLSSLCWTAPWICILFLKRSCKQSKPSSTPSIMDRISYLIFKQCPSLRPALLELFNRVIMEGSVPSSWKVAVIRLIPKSLAKDDPASPGNFRPVALTSTISKLFSGILKNRWWRHMMVNDYLDPDLQKALPPTVPGVVEHHTKLAAVIKSAHQQKQSLGIAWLDIANAYCSVHNEFIQFSMANYHAPPEFCRLL